MFCVADQLRSNSNSNTNTNSNPDVYSITHTELYTDTSAGGDYGLS